VSYDTVSHNICLITSVSSLTDVAFLCSGVLIIFLSKYLKRVIVCTKLKLVHFVIHVRSASVDYFI
jgi:hypothetical protein